MVVSLCFVLLQCVFAAWDDNRHRLGITQQGTQGGPSIATSNYIHAIDTPMGWDSVEPQNNEWDFSSVEEQLDSYIKQQPNISIILMPSTGNVAPKWLYDPPVNVPAVYLNTTNAQGPGPWPWYLDDTYQTYFKRYQSKVYNWVINSKYYPKNIFVSQSMLGTTGDDSPWHGTPINDSYKFLTPQSDEWWEYSKNMSQYIYDLYYKSTPNTTPELLLLFNWGANSTKEDYCTTNWPGAYRKNGMASHGYQLNEEYDAYRNGWCRNLVEGNITIRCRGESNTDQQQADGWWKQAPFWNTFMLVQWSLTYGIDFQGFSSGQIDNKSYAVQFDFFNMFDQYKHPQGAEAAFIGLRDGLDSNDTERFPESIFGEANITNQNRMVKIAQNMSEYGAKQQDPEHATGEPMNQRKAKKMNDVGFGIWRTNYGKFIEQINPFGTSQGRWRIGDMRDPQQIYGRFGRSFDHRNGKDTMCFVLDKNLFGGLPLKKEVNLYFNVTYFDQGTGGFVFGYDAQNDENKMEKMVKKTNTEKWLIKNFEVNDAYFGQRATMNSDFCLYSDDTKADTIFSFIQVYNIH